MDDMGSLFEEDLATEKVLVTETVSTIGTLPAPGAAFGMMALWLISGHVCHSSGVGAHTFYFPRRNSTRLS
jgi:hypothetical protein